MTAGFDETLRTLYSMQSRGAKLKSASEARRRTVLMMEAFARRIGLDLASLRVLHVTGTKGKGSTCALLESLLRSNGVKTGFFSSPHLVTPAERIRIDGRPISDDLFCRYFWQVHGALERSGGEDGEEGMPAFFRMLLLVALAAFVGEAVDVVVLEVGIGGRFDATNVVPAGAVVACGVTQLDLDHMNVLGDTLEKIAWEKGGIFKAGARCFTAPQRSPSAQAVLADCAAAAGEALVEVAPFAEGSLALPLPGAHQLENAALAHRLFRAFRGRGAGGAAPPEEPAALEAAFAQCRWPGRGQVLELERAGAGVRLFLDGAHTPLSLELCCRWFSAAATARRRVLLFNCSHERDAGRLLRTVFGGVGALGLLLFAPADAHRPSLHANPTLEECLASADCGRAAAPRKVLQMGGGHDGTDTAWQRTLAECASHMAAQPPGAGCGGAGGADIGVVTSVAEGVDAAAAWAAGEDVDVLVTGSLYIIGAALSQADWAEERYEGSAA